MRLELRGSEAKEVGSVRLREAELQDAAQILSIYNNEVLNGTSNYEVEAQSLNARIQWLQSLKQGNFPVVVAEIAGQVVGFGAMQPFRVITGFQHTVVASLYVAEGFRGIRVGSQIVESLLSAARQRQYHSVIVGINSLNRVSIHIVERLGFERVGRFREIGFKNGTWFDDICFQLIL